MKNLNSIYKVLDRTINKHKFVSFDEVCVLKNINKKTLLKRGITKKSTKREGLNFPCKEYVCSLFGLKKYDELFNESGEAIFSSEKTTKAYLERLGFKPSDYGFNSIDYKMAA